MFAHLIVLVNHALNLTTTICQNIDYFFCGNFYMALFLSVSVKCLNQLITIFLGSGLTEGRNNMNI